MLAQCHPLNKVTSSQAQTVNIQTDWQVGLSWHNWDSLCDDWSPSCSTLMHVDKFDIIWYLLKLPLNYLHQSSLKLKSNKQTKKLNAQPISSSDFLSLQRHSMRPWYSPSLILKRKPNGPGFGLRGRHSQVDLYQYASRAERYGMGGTGTTHTDNCWQQRWQLLRSHGSLRPPQDHRDQNWTQSWG